MIHNKMEENYLTMPDTAPTISHYLHFWPSCSQEETCHIDPSKHYDAKCI